MKTYDELTGEVLEKVKREKERRRGIITRVASLALAAVIAVGTITAVRLTSGGDDPVRSPDRDPVVYADSGLSVGRDYGDIFRHVSVSDPGKATDDWDAAPDYAVPEDVNEIPADFDFRGTVTKPEVQTADHSGTNVQVAGIDEADCVKTDGEYIYAVGRGAVTVISAKDGEMEIASSFDYIDEDGLIVGSGGALRSYQTPEIYLTDGRLTVVIRAFEVPDDGEGGAENGRSGGIYVPGYYLFRSQSRYFTAIYDITDKTAPRLVGTASVSGNGISSRLKDGTLYLTASDRYYGADEDAPETFIPSICSDGESRLVEPDRIAFGEGTSDCVYLNIAQIDVGSAAVVSNLSLLGYDGDTVYQSEDNLYVSRTGYDFSNAETQEDGFNVSSFSETDYTEIVKISAADGLTLVGSAKIDGHLLNSLSMDEYGGYLRVVTSARKWHDVSKWRDVGADDAEVYEEYPYYDWDNYYGEYPGYYYSPVYDDNGNDTGTVRLYVEDDPGDRNETYNDLYVLDPSMKVTGSLERLAPDERIYSCRFEGTDGYFVTYRETDPLFHVDLSDPASPRIVDELKLPGHSDYLQRFGDLMLGFGQTDVGEIKLSMFSEDESGAMKELSTFVIPGAEYSEALYERHAILADAGRGIICFGAYGWEEDEYSEDYYVVSWNGQGFVLSKKLGLGEGAQSTRGLFIDGCFYVYSLGYDEEFVLSFGLDDFADRDRQELARSEGWEKEGFFFPEIEYAD